MATNVFNGACCIMALADPSHPRTAARASVCATIEKNTGTLQKSRKSPRIADPRKPKVENIT